MRVMDYAQHVPDEPGGTAYPDMRPKQVKDFTLVFELYCPKCKRTDFVKISNTGLQCGQLGKL